MDGAEAALDRTLRAVAEPHRRAILTVIGGEQRAVGQIAETLGLSQQTTSHHLQVLRAAGLVTSSRVGTRHLYAVRTEGLAVGRAFFADFWPDRLQALKRAAEASARHSTGAVSDTSRCHTRSDHSASGGGDG